jgi:hypothetical protein
MPLVFVLPPGQYAPAAQVHAPWHVPAVYVIACTPVPKWPALQGCPPEDAVPAGHHVLRAAWSSTHSRHASTAAVNRHTTPRHAHTQAEQLLLHSKLAHMRWWYRCAAHTRTRLWYSSVALGSRPNRMPQKDTPCHCYSTRQVGSSCPRCTYTRRRPPFPPRRSCLSGTPRPRCRWTCQRGSITPGCTRTRRAARFHQRTSAPRRTQRPPRCPSRRRNSSLGAPRTPPAPRYPQHTTSRPRRSCPPVC